MYKEPTDIMEFIVISLFVALCLFIVFLFFRSNDEIKGALYLNKVENKCLKKAEEYK